MLTNRITSPFRSFHERFMLIENVREENIRNLIKCERLQSKMLRRTRNEPRLKQYKRNGVFAYKTGLRSSSDRVKWIYWGARKGGVSRLRFPMPPRFSLLVRYVSFHQAVHTLAYFTYITNIYLSALAGNRIEIEIALRSLMADLLENINVTSGSNRNFDAIRK